MPTPEKPRLGRTLLPLCLAASSGLFAQGPQNPGPWLPATPNTIVISGGVNNDRRLLSVPFDGSFADLWNAEGERQRWIFEKSPDGISYNIRVEGGVNPQEKRLLSVTPDGSKVDLWHTDDGSGRQRWVVEDTPPLRDQGLVRIRIRGGVSVPERQFLSVTADGSKVDLGHDDGTGRQQWRINPRQAAEFNVIISQGISNPRRFLSVPEDGTKADLWDVDDSSGRQRWVFQRAANNQFLIVVPSGSTQANRRYLGFDAEGRVSLYPRDDGSGRQRWTIEDVGSGLSRIATSNPVNPVRRYLSVTSDGRLVDLYADDNTGRQRWRITLVGVEPAPSVDLSGTYRIRTKATGRFWTEAGNDQLISTRTQTDDTSARFTLQRQTNGSYRIIAAGSGRHLHAAPNDRFLSTRTQPDDNNTRFLFVREADGAFRIRVQSDNAFLHEHGDGDRLISTRFQEFDDNYSRFFLERATIPQTQSISGVTVPKLMALQVTHSRRCLDITSLSPGSNVVQQDCQGLRSQSWFELFVSSPWALLMNSESRLCIEANGDPRSRGVRLVQRGCDPNRKEQWFHLRPAGEFSEKYMLVARNSELCGDIDSFSLNNGAQLLLWDCSRSDNQLFTKGATQATIESEAVETLRFINQRVLGLEDPDPEICWKKTSIRDIGTVPTCPATHPEWSVISDTGFAKCFERCRSGYVRNVLTGVCEVACPAGLREGAPGTCVKEGYDRPSYTIFEKGRCENENRRACELVAALYYPVCNPGSSAAFLTPYHCESNCPAGFTTLPFSCVKPSGYSTPGVDRVCPSGAVLDPNVDPNVALCNNPCPSGSKGVGFVCWGSCSGEFGQECGASCAKSLSACIFSVVEQTTETINMVANITNLVLTAGAAAPVITAARTAGKALGKRTLSATARSNMLKEAKEMFEKAAKDYFEPGKLDIAFGAVEKGGEFAAIAEMMVSAYEAGEFDWTQLAPTAADFDPTGVMTVIRAFNKPICK